MREYKFRRPHKCQNGHINYLYYDLIGDKLCNHRWGEKRCDCPKFNLKEGYSPIGPIEQYIGICDKDGKEIFQGDVIGEYADEQYFLFGIVTYGNDQRSMYAGTFYLAEDLEGHVSDFWESDWSDVSFLEVVGNIYEHPNLIKKAN